MRNAEINYAKLLAVNQSGFTTFLLLSTERQPCDQQLQRSLFGPQPFHVIEEIPSTAADVNSLQKIWPTIQIVEVNHLLKNVVLFDPQSNNAQVTDFLA